MNQHFKMTSIQGSGPGPYLQSSVIVTWQTDLPATEAVDLYFGNNNATQWITIAKGVPNSGSYVWTFLPSDFAPVWAMFNGQGSINLIPQNPLYASYWTSSWDVAWAWLYLPPPPPPAPQQSPAMRIDSCTPDTGDWGTTITLAGSGFSALSDPSSYGGDPGGDGIWIEFAGAGITPYGKQVSGTFSGALNPGNVTDTRAIGITIPSMLFPGKEVSAGVHAIYCKASQGTNVSNRIPFYLGVPVPK